MRFYVAMFLILGVALLIIPTANLGTMQEIAPPQTELSAGQALDLEAEAKEVKAPNIISELEKENKKTKEENKAVIKPEENIQAVNNISDKPFRIKNLTTGAIDIISQKDYARGALCSEMPATFHLEALKAQAVAAHTYALNLQNQAQKAGRDYDFTADPLKWRGYVVKAQAEERFGIYFDEYWKKICTASDSVLNEVLVYSDAPIAAAYHAISAGKTESAEKVWGNEVAYLTAVESPGDIHAAGYEEASSFSADELKNALESGLSGAKLEGDAADWLEIKELSDSGYVTNMRVGNQEISGLEFREALGLRSSHFVISYANNVFKITTKGYGHGVGLSQYGADYMARQGADYKEILLHYYKNALIANVSK